MVFIRKWSDGVEEKFEDFNMSETKFIQFGMIAAPWDGAPVLMALDADGEMWFYDKRTEEEERADGVTSGWEYWEKRSTGFRKKA